MAISRDTMKKKPAKPEVQSEGSKNISADTAKAISVDQEIIGSLSKNIALVANLGNPADIDTIVIDKGKDDKGQAITDTLQKPRIVGYRIQNVGDKDIDWVETGLTEAWSKKNRLDHGTESVKKVLKPGETADLTIFETAFLLSRPEFAAEIRGGEFPVTASYPVKKSTSGADKASDEELGFRLSPSAGENGTSFRMADVPYIEILTFDESVSANGNKVRSNLQIKEGFEKFKPIADRRTASRPGSRAGKRAVKASWAPNAAAFFERSASNIGLK